MMKQKWNWLVMVAVCGVGLIGCSEAPEAAPESNEVLLAAPGRIEGATETYRLGTSAQAPVARIPVVAGDVVKAGQILVELQCADLQAELASASFRADAAQALLTRLQQGYRQEEIDEARGHLRASEAELDRAVAQANRFAALRKQGMVSADALDAARRDELAARGRLQAAEARTRWLSAGYRPEEVAEAESELRSAQEAIKAHQERLAMCQIRAPVDGHILRVHVTPGELVSPLNPLPLVSMSDLSRFRVRIEVDERDVGLVRVGQKARIRSDADPERSFIASVEEISRVMGRKRILGTDPAEKSDRDVLEVILALETDPKLPVGLRVSAQLLR